MSENYPVEFRQSETEKIFGKILAGESLCLVGLAGSGKSHLVRHLMRESIQRYHLARLQQQTDESLTASSPYPGPQSLLLVRVDLMASQPPLTGQPPLYPFYKLIYQELIQAVRHHPSITDDLPDVLQTTLASIDEKKHYDNLHTSLSQSIGEVIARLPGPIRRVIVILESANRLFDEQQGVLYRNLRALRDTHHRELLYLITTRRSVRRIVQMASREKMQQIDPFIELVFRNVVYISLYRDNDFDIALNALRTRFQHMLPSVISAEQRQRVKVLSGGHGRLMRCLIEHLPDLDITRSVNDNIRALSSYADVTRDCARILESLPAVECRTLQQIFRQTLRMNQARPLDTATALDDMVHVGLIRRNPQMGIFQPGIMLLEPHVETVCS